jgi:hypothetical protein
MTIKGYMRALSRIFIGILMLLTHKAGATWTIVQAEILGQQKSDTTADWTGRLG